MIEYIRIERGTMKGKGGRWRGRRFLKDGKGDGEEMGRERERGEGEGERQVRKIKSRL